MPTFEARHVEPKVGTDTVVFVHGLIGDIVKTWGRFPELLRADPDLPKLDVLLCGYRSHLLRWDPNVEEAGKRLISALELQVEQDHKVFLVGHSMGGLIIFSGLSHAMSKGNAQERPCREIEWITLFASPINGSQAAAVLRAVWWGLRYVGFLPLGLVASAFGTRQIGNLARGAFVDDLVAEIVNRIYSPTIDAGDANAKRKIPIRAVVGSEDFIVTENSAKAFFQDPPPLVVTGTHGTVKEPESHYDIRYRAFAMDLAACFQDEFVRMCAQCAGGDEVAQAMFWDRWEHAIAARIRSAFPNEADAQELHESLATLTWEFAPKSADAPPKATFDKALLYLKHLRRGKTS